MRYVIASSAQVTSRFPLLQIGTLIRTVSYRPNLEIEFTVGVARVTLF